jgi:DNA-directed RNA polymerase specialized sigma24 family protein
MDPLRVTTSEQGPKTWRAIEQLFALREKLKEHVSVNRALLHTIRIQEVESMLYERLVENGKPIVHAVAYGNGLADDQQAAVLHEAIGKMFDAYAGFKGTASLKTYFSRIVEHLVIDHSRRIRREQRHLDSDEKELHRASGQDTLDAFSDTGNALESNEGFADAENILERLDFTQIGLTDKEFLAVVLKLASVCLMKKKVPDVELARKVNMRREAFVDAYLRGRNKICRYLKRNGRS